MKTTHWLIALLAATGVAACSQDGPAEEAGEDADAAIEEMTGEDSDTMEDAGEAVDEAADDMQDAAEEMTEEGDEPQSEPQ
ncbi:hypothetical protein [Maricaulis sp.]|uniref:hypothetical protein n=1 Tax=Maricaulis sp. TaxID=1486257 RepID=UPI00262193C6|nr:hypothetical protein [Maricaulis sp.]